jgi:hypothetical protein
MAYVKHDFVARIWDASFFHCHHAIVRTWQASYQPARPKAPATGNYTEFICAIARCRGLIQALQPL